MDLLSSKKDPTRWILDASGFTKPPHGLRSGKASARLVLELQARGVTASSDIPKRAMLLASLASHSGAWRCRGGLAKATMKRMVLRAAR